MRLLIKYASRGRPHKFKGIIENIKRTIGSTNYFIIVSCDLNDTTMNNKDIQDFCALHPEIRLCYGNNRNKIEAINADIDWSEHWDWLLNMSDDMVFIEQNWFGKMLGLIGDHWPGSTDWFAHFNDGFVGEKLPTMTIMGREYAERFFYVYPPCYKSVSCDAEAMFVAQMLGKWAYFPVVYFEHRHPANGSGSPDATYIMNHGYGQHDTTTYFNRMKKLFYVNNPVCIPEQMKPYLK